MELTFPINLIGIDDKKTTGEVLTKHGEYLGTWMLDEDKPSQTGSLHFIADGETEPLFSEGISSTDSRMLFGLAMSLLTSSIREWHEGQSGEDV